VLLDRGRRGLEQEHVVAVNRLLDLDVEFTVRIALAHALTESEPKRTGNSLRQQRIRRPGDDR
jgi:hypothetical protein